MRLAISIIAHTGDSDETTAYALAQYGLAVCQISERKRRPTNLIMTGT